jgi:hypothetical protein
MQDDSLSRLRPGQRRLDRRSALPDALDPR